MIYPEWSFNPRAREGRDRAARAIPTLSRQFQSTRPRGARHHPVTIPRRTACFNPRAREGRDIPGRYMQPAPSVFQSTRPRGARLPNAVRPLFRLLVSIHAPARGATQAWRYTVGPIHCFNPRAREERDVPTANAVPVILPFQSTRPRGARLGWGSVSKMSDKVSIHAPARGATV